MRVYSNSRRALPRSLVHEQCVSDLFTVLVTQEWGNTGGSGAVQCNSATCLGVLPPHVCRLNLNTVYRHLDLANGRSQP